MHLLRTLAAASSLVVVLAGCKRGTPEPDAQPTAKGEPPAKESPPAGTPSSPATATAAEAPPAPTASALPAPTDVGAAPADAKRTASGLASRVLTPGTGKDHPSADDRVKVHYTGWTKAGTMFDSSITRNEPAVFGVGQVIPGWTEALKLMVVGEKRRLWIPAKLAYGETAPMGAPAGDLVFDVELIEIMKPPAVPEDVKAAPATAKKTASGLAYRVLKAGTGKDHPSATNRVTVHYSGWTPDGKMFDSSVSRGQPTTFPLNGVIKGWTEGVQLMVVGEKSRFWIPGSLAYGDTKRPGAPTGPLVFDIELLAIQ